MLSTAHDDNAVLRCVCMQRVTFEREQGHVPKANRTETETMSHTP